jgi:hypothetical protein
MLTRPRRRHRHLLWSLGLLFGLAALPAVATAQEPPPVEGEGESSGDPLYGYVGTAFLGAGVIFILCKTARRN